MNLPKIPKAALDLMKPGDTFRYGEIWEDNVILHDSIGTVGVYMNGVKLKPISSLTVADRYFTWLKENSDWYRDGVKVNKFYDKRADFAIACGVDKESEVYKEAKREDEHWLKIKNSSRVEAIKLEALITDQTGDFAKIATNIGQLEAWENAEGIRDTLEACFGAFIKQKEEK